jgi:hypothetical protein
MGLTIRKKMIMALNNMNSMDIAVEIGPEPRGSWFDIQQHDEGVEKRPRMRRAAVMT